MLYTVGTTVNLSWVAAEDYGPASVAVTAPSGVVTTVTGVTAVNLVYTAKFTTAEPGRHTVLWSATTLTDKGAYEDVLEVRQSAPNALISLDQAREVLRLRASDRDGDGLIQTYIEAASNLVTDITGPMQRQTFTEWFDGGVSTVVPSQQNLTQVTLAKEYYGLMGFTLTEQPLGAQTNAFAFSVDYATGQIMRRTFGGAPAVFAQGAKNVEIQYQAGLLVVPENVQIATTELVRHLYQATQVMGKRRGAGASDDGFGEVPIGFAVPNFVVEMLQPNRREPGIA